MFDTGSGNAPVQTPGFAALKNDATDITEIVIEKPPAGRWTVETAADSSRLVEALQADGTRPVTATAKVTGSGHDRSSTTRSRAWPPASTSTSPRSATAAGSIIGRVVKDGRAR